MVKSQVERKGPAEKDRSADVCFYGPMCTRPNCKYTHETPEDGVNVEPCRLDLAGLCRATAETCKKRHVQGVERNWLIQKMARTPCRHALECRTKNCLFKHPSKPNNFVNGSDANPQQASRHGGEPNGGLAYDRLAAAAALQTPPHSPPIAMPVPMPYQFPPHPLYLGYPMYSYYPQTSYFMGMVPSTMYYDYGGVGGGGYPNVPAYQQSSIMAPPLYAYESGGSTDIYPRSISIPESMYGEGSVIIEGGSLGLSPQFLPSSPTSSSGVPRSLASLDGKNEASLSIPHSSSEETQGDPEKAKLHDDAHDASSSLTCVVIEATTSVLSSDEVGQAVPTTDADTDPC